MRLNLFGKLFQTAALFLVLVELLSLLAQFFPWLNQVAFIIIVAAAFILALYKLESGLYILLAELFTGGLGYLFWFDFGGTKVSLRIGLFLVIFTAWAITQSLKLKTKSLNLFYSLLAIIILYGLFNGWRQNNPAFVFADANGWFYFALLPVFWRVLKEEKNRENILQILTGATGFLAAKTLAVLFLFSHNFAGLGGIFYNWIRDTRAGEITYVSGAIFRVFFQSQIYGLIGFFVILAILIGAKKTGKKDYFFAGLYLYLASLAVIISQSRSFWVGGLAGLFFLFIFAFRPFNLGLKKIAALFFILLIALASQILLVNLLTGNLSGNLVAKRFNNLAAEPASQSRLSQLGPLTQAIAQKPFFGYGFGKTLTYQSQDPRVLKTNPGGDYTTYAFEWGYLDIALKLGLVGLGVYLALVIRLALRLWALGFGLRAHGSKLAAQSPWLKNLSIGLSLGLIALGVTNIFSPYLNHPLGITYIMIVSAFILSSET